MDSRRRTAGSSEAQPTGPLVYSGWWTTDGLTIPLQLHSLLHASPGTLVSSAVSRMRQSSGSYH